MEIIEKCEASVKDFKMMNPGDVVLIFVYDAQNDILKDHRIEKGSDINIVQEISCIENVHCQRRQHNRMQHKQRANRVTPR